VRADLRTVDPLAKSKRRRVSGDHLKAARLAAGLSQEDLAKQLDVRIATISERENAADGVNWETWLGWAMVCRLPAEWTPPS
jgi:DNA-binding XRE family transcriptional regulator